MRTVVNMCNFNPGLGNRIKAYVSMLGKGLQVLTTNRADSYLFPEIRLASPEDLLKYRGIDGWRLDVEPYERFHTREYSSIDFLFARTPDYFIRKYSEIFRNITINAEVKAHAEVFLSEHPDFAGKIGIHIRSWKNHEERKSWLNMDLFHAALASFPATKNIFLCTDSSAVEKQFRDRYGDRVLTLGKVPEHFIETGNTEDVAINKAAFLDMYLLGQCNTIIGTYASTFTECAWWFGGCKARVLIPMSAEIPENFQRMLFQEQFGRWKRLLSRVHPGRYCSFFRGHLS